MKIIFKWLMLILIISFVESSYADQISLYDETGNVVAVLDRGNETTDRPVLFLASTGDPVAYVDGNSALYTFPGNHIGWYYDNIIWDNYGNIVAFAETNKPDVVTVPLNPRTIVLHNVFIPEIVEPLEVVKTPPPYEYQMSEKTMHALVSQ